MTSPVDLFAAARLGFADRSPLAAMLDEAIAADDPEARRFGDYVLVERLGRGGMGVVFRARQTGLHRDVALKFIVGDADEAPAVARFLDEARTAARLQHPQIVPVYEVGRVEGMHYFSMPLLSGGTLAQRLAAARPDVAWSVALMRKLGAAVDYAHGLGWLHLDLKPANVLFDERGEALIGDFGLARRLDADGGVEPADASGTPAYMAPEQIAGRRLDRRTDVYALGAILYELLCGMSPHGAGDAHAQLAAAAAGQVVPPRRVDAAIDRDLEAICLACLAPDPARRYATAADVVADLARWCDGNDVGVRRPAWHERLGRTVRRHPAVSFAGVAAFAALLVGLAATSWQWRRAEAASAEADRQRAQTVLQSERLQQLAGFMAAAFPADAADEAQAGNARAGVAWLRQHLGADPVAQRAVLASFRDALSAAGKGEAVAALLDAIVDRLGADYRERQVVRLAHAGDRDSLVAAVLIGIPRDADATAASTAHAAALQRLADAYGDDELALYTLALACHVQPTPCAHPEYRARLVERHPGNAVHWLLFPRGATPTPGELAAAIVRAGAARDADDRLGPLVAILRAALREQELPVSIVEPMRAVVGDDEVAPSLRRYAIDAVPLPVYADVVRACRPGSAALADTSGLRDACMAFAQKAMHSPSASILAHMIASVMLRRLAPGTPIAAEAKEYRRRYAWFGVAMHDKSADSERLYEDVVAYGEWEAWQRRAERAGVAREPPAGWLPANPQFLLLPEERAAK